MSDAVKSVSVDDVIYNCLNFDKPKSFFLFAGAGSGKTRTLVEVLTRFRMENITRLKRNGQKVAIITYTNAACDEIKRRLEFDSAFHVSTIHSFAWELIRPYVTDIKNWLRQSLETQLTDLQEKQGKARKKDTKTYIERASKIETKTKRLQGLARVKKFRYNPNGDNAGVDSLNHQEVISIAADFLQTRPLMQSILVRRYPILLIDESQDTNKELIDAFLEVEEKNAECFALGMFGDVMQRIYPDGKANLEQYIPDNWIKPAIEINYRCPKRVVALINRIRENVDNYKQNAFKDEDGTVRLFIVNTTNSIDRGKVEVEVLAQMAKLTGDKSWKESGGGVKMLLLEHHMASKRGGFSEFFDPLYAQSELKTGLLNGTLPGVSFFANQILPLIKALQLEDHFSATRLVRKYSPFLRKDFLLSSTDSIRELEKANNAVKSLYSLWNDNNDPSLSDILQEVLRSELFEIPDVLIPIAIRLHNEASISFEESGDVSDKDNVTDAWEKALACSFSQFEKYARYISDESRFATHHGVKGLEFSHVMVILDDEDAHGPSFSYEKLFGAKEPSETDLKNKSEGKETSIERTRRLFYVTCSRAMKDLAIVAYTKEPEKVREHVLSEGWFEEDEIIHL